MGNSENQIYQIETKGLDQLGIFISMLFDSLLQCDERMYGASLCHDTNVFKKDVTFSTGSI